MRLIGPTTKTPPTGVRKPCSLGSPPPGPGLSSPPSSPSPRRPPPASRRRPAPNAAKLFSDGPEGAGRRQAGHGAAADYEKVLALDPTNRLQEQQVRLLRPRRHQPGSGRRAGAAAPIPQGSPCRPQLPERPLQPGHLGHPHVPSSAILLYQQILAITPKDPNTLYNLGLLLYSSGQVAQGQAMLRQAIFLAPSLKPKLPGDGQALARSHTPRLLRGRLLEDPVRQQPLPMTPTRSSSFPTDTLRLGRRRPRTRSTTTATSPGSTPFGLAALHQPDGLSPPHSSTSRRGPGVRRRAGCP